LQESSRGKKSSGLWPFGRKGSAAAKQPGVFGTPLDQVALSPEGVPEALSSMRRTLLGLNGHLVEGIFRVSPGAASLATARQQAEAGQFGKIADAECLAQLIKLWFRDLPESVFAPCLQPIVDGPPPDGASCGALFCALPTRQRATVEWLLRLMSEIAKHEATNRMTFKSLATVFAPNLVDPPPSVPPLLALEINRRVVTFVERLLEHEVAAGCLQQA